MSKYGTFVCAECGGMFEKGRSDEEAMEEAKQQWGGVLDEGSAVICDDCYKDLLARNSMN